LLVVAGAFAAQGLTALKGLTDPEWLGVSGKTFLGFFMVVTSIVDLLSPSSQSHPAWTKWATLVIGLGLVFYAGASAWRNL
jgi:uncharacterized membrane protein YgdD (TMEM256/DUF423 family)